MPTLCSRKKVERGKPMTEYSLRKQKILKKENNLNSSRHSKFINQTISRLWASVLGDLRRESDTERLKSV